MPNILDNIKCANDIKKVRKQDYDQLAREIRSFLVQNISKTGGHLASNLGVVELTMALHLFLGFPKDKLVWDVGHQAYIHKLLTGRKDLFSSLRQLDGLSGFPKVEESNCDAFDTGHSSTSISAALGMVKARDLAGEKHKVIAVIGDGALTGGMAYEALNNAGRLKSNMVIVLNDNDMSISENVGGMANYLANLRTNNKYTGFKEGMERVLAQMPKVGKPILERLKRSKDAVKYFMLPSMFFEDMGLTYIGPIDGHNMEQLATAFQAASKAQKAVVVHVITRKGKGYKLAEKYPSKFHGIDPFDVSSGKTLAIESGSTYTKVFSDAMVRYGAENNKIVAITAAMPNGTGLSEFKKHYPDRFVDVGIAEEHAVTFAAGLARSGFRPVVAIYSTFLQRAYDQIIHDVCINELPVTFILDRAGISGKDGKTHQGIFDISFLSHIPNLQLLAPKDHKELDDMLGYALKHNGPVAIRFPKGRCEGEFNQKVSEIISGKSELLQEGSKVAILAAGSMVKTAKKVMEDLAGEGITGTLVNVRFISPFDGEMVMKLAKDHEVIVTMEENIRSGGYGQKVADFLCEHGLQGTKLLNISIPDGYVEHGEVDELHERVGIDHKSVFDKVKKVLM